MLSCFTASTSEPGPETVSCETCKCLVRKVDAARVKTINYTYGNSTRYYCQAHKPPYDEVVIDYVPVKGKVGTLRQVDTHYITKRVQVDKKGKEV